MMTALFVQARPPQSMMDMVLGGTWPTRIVLLVLALFSVVSLWVIFAKMRHFRAVAREGDSFLTGMENASSLDEASRAVITMSGSPYTRLFRGGLNFVNDILGGGTQSTPDYPSPARRGLSLTQLEALRMVLEKLEAEEADEMAHGLNWLAVIGSVSPLLGLMGTVIGIMNTFLDITRSGSTNIGAVAPGIAEALITTVAGLAVAIPSVMAYNHFASRLNLVMGELEGFASEFIGTLAREQRV